MLQSGVTELIWHFAGYLHLIDELGRARVQYEDMLAAKVENEFEPDAPQDDTKNADLDELSSGRSNVFWPDADQLHFRPSVEDYKFIDMQALPVEFSLSDDASYFRFPPISVAGVGATLRMDNVTRQEGGDQTNVDIDQYNLLNDNDRVGFRADVTFQQVTGINVAEEIDALREMAHETVPEGLFPIGGGNIQVVSAHLTEMLVSKQESGEEPSTLDVGVYIDGILQPEGTDVEAPGSGIVGADGERREGAPPAVPEQQDGWRPGDPGLQGAELGSNAVYNAAVIIDADEAAGTFVVLGNYYRSNVIVQTNVYSDSDCVKIGDGASGQDAYVALGDNTALNIAEIARETLIDEAFDFRGFTGFTWNIDISYGDYFDIKSLYQENVMYSNDMVYQQSTNAHYRVMADGNGQANVSQVADWGNGYDLIVVLGDYVSGNFIHQTNILFDNDWIIQAGGSDGGDQSIYGGQNLLTNHAAITTYGLDGFGEVSAGFEAFLRGLETKDYIAPQDWWAYSGSGSTHMNVLFVKGDYYDINFVRQLNLVADSDAAVQIGGDGAGQFVSTGGNTATNFASIVDVGAYGDQYVGGEVYEEWTLIQTNVIASDEDEIVYGDTDQLASEVVAFTYMSEEEAEQIDPSVVPLSMGGDELGQIMT